MYVYVTSFCRLSELLYELCTSHLTDITVVILETQTNKIKHAVWILAKSVRKRSEPCQK